jgi:hypothetical protein
LLGFVLDGIDFFGICQEERLWALGNLKLNV